MNEKLKSVIYPEKKHQIFLYLTLSGILSGLCMAFPTLLGAAIEWLVFIPAALALHCASKKGCSLKQAFGGGFWLNALFVAIGEVAVLFTLGWLLYATIRKRKLHTRLFG